MASVRSLYTGGYTFGPDEVFISSVWTLDNLWFGQSWNHFVCHCAVVLVPIKTTFLKILFNFKIKILIFFRAVLK